MEPRVDLDQICLGLPGLTCSRVNLWRVYGMKPSLYMIVPALITVVSVYYATETRKGAAA